VRRLSSIKAGKRLNKDFNRGFDMVYVLIAVMMSQYSGSTTMATLGEFEGMAACQNAAKAVKKANKEMGVSDNVKLICAAKRG
jgi:hypothetical protein